MEVISQDIYYYYYFAPLVFVETVEQLFTHACDRWASGSIYQYRLIIIIRIGSLRYKDIFKLNRPRFNLQMEVVFPYHCIYSYEKYNINCLSAHSSSPPIHTRAWTNIHNIYTELLKHEKKGDIRFKSLQNNITTERKLIKRFRK